MRSTHTWIELPRAMPMDRSILFLAATNTACIELQKVKGKNKRGCHLVLGRHKHRLHTEMPRAGGWCGTTRFNVAAPSGLYYLRIDLPRN